MTPASWRSRDTTAVDGHNIDFRMALAEYAGRGLEVVFHFLFLGSVDVGFQPDPGPGQIQKAQVMMCVLVVAGGHAPPVLEPADTPFHGVARPVPFRVVGPGVHAPLPGGHDGLNAPPRPPRAQGVAVLVHGHVHSVRS